MKYKFYIAAPFFNDEQVDRVERVKQELINLGHEFYSPKDECVVSNKNTNEELEECFKSNLKAIENCDFVLAVTDGKDVGTLFEAGYAYAKGKRIIYLCETIGDNAFNLMLAKSCVNVLKRAEELKNVNLEELDYEYEGNIE